MSTFPFSFSFDQVLFKLLFFLVKTEFLVVIFFFVKTQRRKAVPFEILVLKIYFFTVKSV